MAGAPVAACAAVVGAQYSTDFKATSHFLVTKFNEFEQQNRQTPFNERAVPFSWDLEAPRPARIFCIVRDEHRKTISSCAWKLRLNIHAVVQSERDSSDETNSQLRLPEEWVRECVEITDIRSRGETFFTWQMKLVRPILISAMLVVQVVAAHKTR